MNGLGPGDWNEHVWYGSDEATLDIVEAKYFAVANVLMLHVLRGRLYILPTKSWDLQSIKNTLLLASLISRNICPIKTVSSNNF